MTMDPDQEQYIIRCQYCEEEPAEFHCVPCGDELCLHCKIFHLKSKVPSGHNVISISERLHPINMFKMCESHPSKPYDASCEDCQVPVCILCIQEIHNKHGIVKMQDMYEKLKAKAMKELFEMKTQKRVDIIRRINDIESGELRINTIHENMKKAMTKQAKDIIDNVNAILSEALDESKSDKMKNLQELSEHKTELENYQRNVEHFIEKLENLTDSRHPADLILYRKQNPDEGKQLKCPDAVVISDPAFTVGQLNKRRIAKQFGKMTKMTKIKLVRVKTEDEITQYTQKKRTVNPATQNSTVTSDGEENEENVPKRRKVELEKVSANNTLLPKTVLQQPVKLSEIKLDKRGLRHVVCVGDERVYISGGVPEILLIDRSTTHIDTIAVDKEPSGLAVMIDGSLIYSVRDDCAICRIFPNQQKTTLVNTLEEPIGLCCTKSGEILVCVCIYEGISAATVSTIKVVRYSSTGEKIQESKILRDIHVADELSEKEWPICENVNGDICIGHNSSNWNTVMVCSKSGKVRFHYEGRGGNYDRFTPRDLATDSLGHILISDNTNHVVHLISQDGDFISEILIEDDWIPRPRGIAVDHSDNLWLLYGQSDILLAFQDPVTKVEVYQYLSSS